MALPRQAGSQSQLVGGRTGNIPQVSTHLSADWDEIDELFSVGGMEVDRSGCPPASTLAEIAHQPVGHDDSIYAHLERCGACYVQVRREARRPN
jgi:hypothetical protein